MTDEIHGTIENWYVHGTMVFGQVYGDTKGRFSDGEHIHTSAVQSGPDQSGIITTRNSRYKLGRPAWRKS